MSEWTVVKVGGSLYDLPDFVARLQSWLAGQQRGDFLLVPGGGRIVDVLRDLDRLHGLGEEKAHWLALRALALNARLLLDLLPGARMLESSAERPVGIGVLDPLAFCIADEHARPTEALPRSWDVTSDSIAARAAIAGGAGRLVLLKSITIPPEMTWIDANRRGFVDPTFASLVAAAPGLRVRAINFRDS